MERREWSGVEWSGVMRRSGLKQEGWPDGCTRDAHVQRTYVSEFEMRLTPAKPTKPGSQREPAKCGEKDGMVEGGKGGNAVEKAEIIQFNSIR